MNKKKNRGFSLVELIVVVAIMAVLVGVLAPSLLRYVEKTRIQKDVSAVSEVREAVIVAMADEDIFSKTPSGSTVAISNGLINVTATGTGADATALKGELDNVIGTSGVTLSSNDLKASTITLTITITGTNVKCECTAVTGANLDDYTKSSLKALGYTAPANNNN